MTTIITKKQKNVLDFIKKFIGDNGISPTVREIQEGIRVKSVRTATQYLESLERKGLILRNNRNKRNIEIITDEESGFVSVKIIGSAGCDNLDIFADQSYDNFIKIDRDIVKDKKVVAIKSQGASMVDAGIYSGDIVITELTQHPDNKEIVVAIIDGQAVIKRISYSKGSVVLNPESADKIYKPIIIKNDNFKIIGRVLDIIKHPKNEEGIQYINIDE